MVWSRSMFPLVTSAAMGLPVEEAEKGLELELPLLGLTKAQIKKVMNYPIPEIPAIPAR